MFSVSAELGTNLVPDRDPTRWHLDEKAIECRRRVFWEVYSADLMNVRAIDQHSILSIIIHLHVLQSGLLGRPPSIELSYVDCAFPNDGEDPDIQRA